MLPARKIDRESGTAGHHFDIKLKVFAFNETASALMGYFHIFLSFLFNGAEADPPSAGLADGWAPSLQINLLFDNV